NPTLLRRNETAARYTPAGGGRLLFVRNDNLYAQRLNLKTRELEKESQLIQEDIASGPGLDNHRADFSVSKSGAVASRPGKAALSQVTIFDRQGKEIGKAGPPGMMTSLSLSPDETRLLAHDVGQTWLLDASQPGHLSLEGRWEWVLWSPDGSKLWGQEKTTGRRIGERSLTSGDIRGFGDSPGTLHDISPDGKDALFRGH